MTTKLETELTKFLSNIVAIKTLLENNKAILKSVPRLADFLANGLINAEASISYVTHFIELARKLPLAFAYAKMQIQLYVGFFGKLTTISSELEKECSSLKKFERKNLASVVQLIDDLRKPSEKILYQCTVLKEESKEKAALQYYKQVKIDQDKIINLTINYGGANAPGNPLSDLFMQIDYTKPEKVLELIQKLNEKLISAVASAFASTFFNHVLGPVFTKSVQIYVYYERGLEKTIAGCLREIVRKVQSIFKTRKVFFVPTIEDMRFSIELKHLQDANVTNIESLIVHEISHAYDEKLIHRKFIEEKRILEKEKRRYENPKIERRVYDKIREEGLATFQEVVHNPDSLDAFQKMYAAMWSEALKKPFQNLDVLEKEEKQDVEFSYGLGLFIMLQLFLTLSAKLKRKTKPQPISLLIQGIVPPDIRLYPDIGISLINMVRLMDSKKFFEFYRKRVNRPVFSEALFDEIQLNESKKAE